MAYKQREFGTSKISSTMGNAGDKWGEVWVKPRYSEVGVTNSRYGITDTKVSRMGEERIGNLPEYTRDKVHNRSEVLAERRLRKAKRREDRIIATQGSEATRSQRRDIGNNEQHKASERANARAIRKAARVQRREARQARRDAKRNTRN